MFVTASVEPHENPALVDVPNSAERAVKPAPLRIVLHSHDPRPNPQFEVLGDRQPVSVDLQPPDDLGMKDDGIGGQGLQAALVVALCGSFGGREEERLSGGSMWTHTALVQKGDRVRNALAQADLAQDV